MTYRIDPLPLTVARPFFALSDTELVAIGARRMVADAPNSAPAGSAWSMPRRAKA